MNTKTQPSNAEIREWHTKQTDDAIKAGTHIYDVSYSRVGILLDRLEAAETKLGHSLAFGEATSMSLDTAGQDIKELEEALTNSVHADAFLLKRIKELEAKLEAKESLIARIEIICKEDAGRTKTEHGLRQIIAQILYFTQAILESK